MEQADLWAGQAMARIAAEGLQPTPPYFTVWYTYYSGQLPDLTRVVDRLAATGQPFTPAELDALWQRFFSYDREQKVVRDTGERIQGALVQLIDLLRSAGVDAGRYAGTLCQFSARLDTPELEPLRSLLDVIVTETELVARLNQELERRIQATAAEMEELRRSLDGARREADTDALTGLFNRRRFDAVLYETVSQAALSSQPVSLLMLDIDHFKKVNDSHGYAVGDQVLALVARMIRERLRAIDTAARFGGEEFAAILPDCALAGALKMAEKIRRAIASRQIVNRSQNRTLGTITLSIGAAGLVPGETPAALIERADRGLYAAKHAGRNRVVAVQDAGAGQLTPFGHPAPAASEMSDQANTGQLHPFSGGG